MGAGRGNVQIWGTQPDAIDEAEDRDRWMDLLERLDIKQPPGTMATTEEGALAASAKCVMNRVAQLTTCYEWLMCSLDGSMDNEWHTDGWSCNLDASSVRLV